MIWKNLQYLQKLPRCRMKSVPQPWNEHIDSCNAPQISSARFSEIFEKYIDETIIRVIPIFAVTLIFWWDLYLNFGHVWPVLFVLLFPQKCIQCLDHHTGNGSIIRRCICLYPLSKPARDLESEFLGWICVLFFEVFVIHDSICPFLMSWNP